jgi:hypothetical protein
MGRGFLIVVGEVGDTSVEREEETDGVCLALNGLRGDECQAPPDRTGTLTWKTAPRREDG